MLPGLYNTEISERRCVGFCKKHHCYVTATQLKQKECLKKQCYYLERHKHEFWTQRELTKAKRRNRKVVVECQ